VSVSVSVCVCVYERVCLSIWCDVAAKENRETRNESKCSGTISLKDLEQILIDLNLMDASVVYEEKKVFLKEGHLFDCVCVCVSVCVCLCVSVCVYHAQIAWQRV